MLVLKLILIAVIGYFMGNISFGIITAKYFAHTDIRTQGSGNAGTTNVLRTLGWLPSVLTLAGDALKAWLAAFLGSLIAGEAGLLVGGLCAVIGHIWPVLLGFKGGKGIAPSLGMIIAIHPLIAVLLLAGQIVIVGITGYMSIASLASAVLFPAWTAILMHGRANFPLFLLFSILTAAITIYAHRENIRRLLEKKENKLNFKSIKFLQKSAHASRRK